MGIIGSETGSNEAVRCKYISAILFTSPGKSPEKDHLRFTIRNEATGRVDYAIKK